MLDISSIVYGSKALSTDTNTRLSLFDPASNERIIGEISSGVVLLLLHLDSLTIDDQNIVRGMKLLGRSGKKVRIEKSGIGLSVQSLYDHVLSFAEIVDIFGEKYYYGASIKDLVVYIALHDSSEVFYVDVPYFTSPELAGATHLSKEEKKRKELYYNSLICQHLSGDIKVIFQKMVINEDIPQNLKDFLKFVDKVEPIVAIWKYIKLFKDKFDIENFIEVMADFFDNHNIPGFAVDEKTLELVHFFQNKDNARAFYKYGDSFWNGVSLQHWKGYELNRFIDFSNMQVI